MPTTDLPVICIVESVLTIFSIYAGFRDHQLNEKDKLSECSAQVTRSPQTMATIYTVYGSSTAFLFIIINNANTLEGNKVIFILWNFICITYTFFFSSWFRNAILFPLIKRISED